MPTCAQNVRPVLLFSLTDAKAWDKPLIIAVMIVAEFVFISNFLFFPLFNITHLERCLQTIPVFYVRNIFPQLVHGLTFDMGKVCLCLPSAMRSQEELTTHAFLLCTHMGHGLISIMYLKLQRKISCFFFFSFPASQMSKNEYIYIFCLDVAASIHYHSVWLLLLSWNQKKKRERKQPFWLISELYIRWQHGSVTCFEKLWFFLLLLLFLAWFWGNSCTFATRNSISDWVSHEEKKSFGYFLTKPVAFACFSLRCAATSHANLCRF